MIFGKKWKIWLTMETWKGLPSNLFISPSAKISSKKHIWGDALFLRMVTRKTSFYRKHLLLIIGLRYDWKKLFLCYGPRTVQEVRFCSSPNGGEERRRYWSCSSKHSWVSDRYIVVSKKVFLNYLSVLKVHFDWKKKLNIKKVLRIFSILFTKVPRPLDI